MLPLAIAGLASGLLGSKMQADAQKDAANAAAQAAQFNPYNVTGPFGGTYFNRQTGHVRGELDPASQEMRGLLSSLGLSHLQGEGPTAGFQGFANDLGNQGIPGLFQGAIDSSGAMPTGAFSGQQDIMSMLSGLTGGAGQGFLNAQNQGLFNQLAGQGQGLLGQAVSGFTDPNSELVTNRLDLLRQQAAPQEERAFNSLQQRLFSQGRMGSTGGSRDMEAFARGLGQADLGRQMEAQNLGMTAAGQLGNMGQGLLSQAQGMQGLDISRAGLAPSLFGLSGQFANQGFGAAMDMSNLTNSRAQQRLTNAMQLFGFGNEMQTNDFNKGLSSLQGIQSIDTQLRNLIALGGNIGGQHSAAGGNVAQALLQNNQSPFGGFLGGFGSSLLDAAFSPSDKG